MKIWKKMLSIMLARGRIKIKKHLYLLTIFSVCFIALLLSAVTVSATDTVASGACGTDGDNLTWTLDNDGVLTISGSGAMEDYYEQNEAQPWEDGRYDIKSVIVNSGVTSIGKHAFFECPNLTSVNINGSVVSIGFGAFEECRNLTSIEIPNGVKSIGACAFFRCSSLTNVNIPNSVTGIGDQAFSHCSSLTSINVDTENKKYDSRNNCNAIIETESNTLIRGCSTTLIPSSVTNIEFAAFEGCRNLTSIEIPSSVTNIDSGAFAGCVSLTSINVDPENKKYDSRDNCNAIIETKSNTLISGCSTTLIPDGVTSIGNEAFSYYDNLTSVNIPNSVTSIGEWAFYYCKSLKNIEIPDGAISIGEDAFGFCVSLSSVSIPNSVTSIGDFAFEGCNSITDVYYGGTEAEWGKISIENGNEALNTATKHYTEYTELIEIIENNSGKVSVNVHNLKPSYVYLAIYSTDGKLLRIFEQTVPVRAETVEFSLNGVNLPEGYSMKAFLISEDDLAPVVEADELE